VAQSTNGRGLGSGANWGGGSLSIAGTAFVIAEGNAALADIGSAFTAFTIGGTAEVFTVNGTFDASLSTAHTREPGVLVPAGVDLTGVGNAYNFASPAGWEGASTVGYFVRRDQSIAAQQKAANPQTGDSSHVYLFVIIAFIMAAITAVILLVRKKALQH